MSTVQQTWLRQIRPFTETVAIVTDWEAASPCEGWSARDVLEHVIGTQRDVLSDHGHPLAPISAEEPTQRWAEHAAAMDRVIEDDALIGTVFDGFFGPTTIGETLLRFYGFDLLVHRWDLARSQGEDVEFTAEELVEMEDAIDGYGDAAYLPGIFAPALEVGADASTQQRVLARTGRRA